MDGFLYPFPKSFSTISFDLSNNCGSLKDIISNQSHSSQEGAEEWTECVSCYLCITKGKHKTMCWYLYLHDGSLPGDMTLEQGFGARLFTEYIAEFLSYVTMVSIQNINFSKYKNKDTKPHWLGLFSWPLGAVMTTYIFCQKWATL